MPTKTLPDKVVRRLLGKGLGPTEVVNELAKQGVYVTPNAITMWNARHGEGTSRRRYEDTLPWRIAPQHKHLYAAKMLRREGARLAGETLTPEQLQQLDNWKNKLAHLPDPLTDEEYDCVVHYDPRSDSGFLYVPRRPGIDTGLIRVPDPD